MKFKIGDIVSLKSGGEDMTIMDIDNTTQMVHCVWHINGEPKEARYPMAVIELSDQTEYDF